MTRGSIEVLRKYYNGKYKKIFNKLEEKGAKNYIWDKNCLQWIEMWCEIDGKRIKINIGINNKYNLWIESKYMASYNTQNEIVDELERRF